MRWAKSLFLILKKIEGKGYRAYKQIEGAYEFPEFCLYIDHVQQDPYAPPSRVRVRVKQRNAKIPPRLFKNRIRKIALEDYLTRCFAKNIHQVAKGKRGSGKSGKITILPCSQKVLERTCMKVNEEFVEVRFFVGLPARGRKILGKEAEEMFFKEVPLIVKNSLFHEKISCKELERHIYTVEDAQYIRDHLKERGLVAFVGNNSHLPRASGVDERPLLSEKVIPFTSPPSLEVTFNLPNSGTIKGMGIPQGITLIVGGGYHGKSTLLNALAAGCYNHIPGDGREWVVTVEDAVKIRAEDGRFISNVDISPFINHLPFGEDTTSFSTKNASGSTSQAANIIEALEAGTSLLLIDEDTSATNFMIRDERMQELVVKEKEPITPLIDKIKLLYRDLKVSTILVMGGSGDYFDVADTVIMLDSYRVFDVSEKARTIAKKHRTSRRFEGGESFGKVKERFPLKESFNPYKAGKVNIKTRGKEKLIFGKEVIDLSCVEQIVEEAQVKSIGDIIYYMAKNIFNENISLRKSLDIVEEKIKKGEIDTLFRIKSGEYALPRRQEIAASINRLPSLKCKTLKNA
ncbi:MAG TPA: ATPase [Candidatus Aerophobetes bacterium]|uniref:ATPase n=1 Tax=Aerophobetes bacterium TaxID=2030807 RepID=A0A7V5LZA6_UNCAE|nr:ATPase [Candidatus Aerophobetes bacterium]